MAIIASLALLMAGLSGLASSMPVDPSGAQGSFSVDTMPNPNFVPHGPTAMYKAFLKYGKGSPPPGLVKTVMDHRARGNAKREFGGAGAIAEDGEVAWLTPVSIGDPAQTLNLDFDCGSSDLWVFSDATPAYQSEGHLKYNPKTSHTSELMPDWTWTIRYGDGSSAKGIVYDDKVTVGNLTLDTQAVQAATKVSDQFVRDKSFGGILGLAFSSINSVVPKQQKTWFENIKDSLDSAVWTVNLRHSAPGSYNFGNIDPSLHTGDIHYADVDSHHGYWTFTTSGYQIGQERSGDNITGFADTGTSVLLLPSSVTKAYYANVAGASKNNIEGGYVFPCTASLPDFTFTVGGGDITIPGQYMNFSSANAAEKTCFGGIQDNSIVGGRVVIFGDIALKAAYVVLEDSIAHTRIGWATKDLSLN